MTRCIKCVGFELREIFRSFQEGEVSNLLIDLEKSYKVLKPVKEE